MKKNSIKYTLNKGLCSAGLISFLLLSGCEKKEAVINKDNSTEVTTVETAEERQRVKISISATSNEQLINLLEELANDLPTLTANYCITELEITNASLLSNLEEKDKKKIESIIQSCTDLTTLKIEGVDLKGINLNCLENLANLTDLTLYRTSLEDLSSLESLSNLEKLNITLNHVSDITFLSTLVSLENLNISYNYIEDISVIESLPALSFLNTTSNPLNPSLQGVFSSREEIETLLTEIPSVTTGYTLEFLNN